jgi:hypothetical protein
MAGLRQAAEGKCHRVAKGDDDLTVRHPRTRVLLRSQIHNTLPGLMSFTVECRVAALYLACISTTHMRRSCFHPGQSSNAGLPADMLLSC